MDFSFERFEKILDFLDEDDIDGNTRNNDVEFWPHKDGDAIDDRTMAPSKDLSEHKPESQFDQNFEPNRLKVTSEVFIPTASV